MAAALPVLAAGGISAIPIPTAVYTAQTGYDNYYGVPVGAEFLKKAADIRKNLPVDLDTILIGFCPDTESLRAIMEYTLPALKGEETFVFVDPVLGDDGERYKCFDEEYENTLRELVKKADYVLPNVTEACLLTGVVEYKDFLKADERGQWDYLAEMCRAFAPATAIITGWRVNDLVSICLYEDIDDPESFSVLALPRCPGSYSGTGDLFAAVLIEEMFATAGDLLKSADKAARFVFWSLSMTDAEDRYHPEGTPFHYALRYLVPGNEDEEEEEDTD
jgi:pyridoxine kinase